MTKDMSKNCPPTLRAIAELYRDRKAFAPESTWQKARVELLAILDMDVKRYDLAMEEFNEICFGPRQ